MMKRRRFLQIGALPLLAAPWLSACSADPRPEDVARLIRDGEFDIARIAAEKLIARGDIDGHMPLLAGALALQAGDFDRARELLAAEASTDTSPATFLSGLQQVHWLRLANLRAGHAGTSVMGGLSLDPVDGAIAGRLSPDFFIRAKVEEARRVADATILSIQQSAGRAAMLDHFAEEDVLLYRCTGNFIAGQRWLAMGDGATAHWFFSVAVGSKAQDLLEFHIAKAELARFT